MRQQILRRDDSGKKPLRGADYPTSNRRTARALNWGVTDRLPRSQPIAEPSRHDGAILPIGSRRSRCVRQPSSRRPPASMRAPRPPDCQFAERRLTQALARSHWEPLDRVEVATECRGLRVDPTSKYPISAPGPFDYLSVRLSPAFQVEDGYEVVIPWCGQAFTDRRGTFCGHGTMG
jgi:hypothetical protein